MNSKEEKEYNERLKKRIMILRDYLAEGKIVVNEKLKPELEKSFNRAQFDENGEPDLSTIDGAIRSLALMAGHMDHRSKMKEAISLFEIQRRYFQMIERNFDHYYQMMIKNKITAHQLAYAFAYKSGEVDKLNEPIELIVEEIMEFWEIYSESAYFHLEDEYESIKAVFGGDLFPAGSDNIASKCGIYTDTIILPCPFIRSRHLFKRWDKYQRVYYMLKHGLNILHYKELALARLAKPIVAILPDKELIAELAIEYIQNISEQDALYHANKIFKRDFKNIDELIDFGEKLDTVEKVLNEVKELNRILFNTESKQTLADQIKNEMEGESYQLLGTNNPGLIVSMLGVGRMQVCNEILLKSAKVRGVPLIDAPTSWEYFKWKLQYDAERSHPKVDYSKLHTVKGINRLGNTSLQWIGKIPPQGLIELRKTGAINEIRSILSKGLDELVIADENNFNDTSHRVFNNLNRAFNQHEKNIKELMNKKWKVAGKDFGSWIVMGSIEIASACIGTPFYGISTVVLSQILDAPKLKDLPKSVKTMKEIEKQKNNLKRSPIGLMFSYKE